MSTKSFFIYTRHKSLLSINTRMSAADELKQVEDKVKILQLKNKQTDSVLASGNERELKKHLQAVGSRVEELCNLKGLIEDIQVASGVEIDAIEKWGVEFDKRIAPYEAAVDAITAKLEHITTSKTITEERAAGRVKRDQPAERENELHVKLPKLTITKFNGTHVDWLRFYSQFEIEIDRSRLASVSKFSYLKELVVPQVRSLIDGLPFTTEGYERAKRILKTKYGKDSEIINAHVKGIMDLPTLTGVKPSQIHSFYESLLSHVQALETMGKLTSVNGYVRLTTDKLPGIRSDLVRDDHDWQDWTFPELVEALRLWTVRNPTSTMEVKQHMPNSSGKKTATFTTHRDESRVRTCVYCESTEHTSSNCTVITSLGDRKAIIVKKKLCFNCTGKSHRAQDCRSKKACSSCGARHHSSI